MKVRSMIANAVFAITIATLFPGMMTAFTSCNHQTSDSISAHQNKEFITTSSESKVLSNVIDGPYVFYKKDKIVVKNIQRINSKAEVVEEIFHPSSQEITIRCAMDPDVGKPFKVVIRKDHPVPPSKYEQPEKILALSDIEGNFKIMTNTLQGNGVIDENYNWTYGKGHLVLVGDFFDRGNQVTPCLWLLYELERQAELAGGFVHFIIGNHEEMNLRGDVRYVRNKYKLAAKKLNVSYRSLYGKNTELGRWLRSKNIIERVGKIIFTHGGLSQDMANTNMHFKDINRIARVFFGVDAWRVKEKGGAPELIFGPRGPMWYRGYFSNELSQNEINSILHKYGANHVIVGHTVVNQISSFYDSKVIAIDVKHEMVVEHGGGNALLIKGDRFLQVNTRGQMSDMGVFSNRSTHNALEAIDKNNKKAIKKFLAAGNDINGYYTNEKVTLLHYAIQKDRAELLDFLINLGANPNQYYNNKTALMYAIKVKNLSAIQFLLENGVDVDKVNGQKKTALYYAAKYGNPQIAKLLIAKGASIEHRDGKGRTPLEYALQYKNQAVARFLRSLE